MKKIGIHTGNVSYGGQEKMLIEFLKILDSKKYVINLFIEEDKGEKNIYEKEIPKYVNFKYLNEKKIMEKIDEYKKSGNLFKKLMRSFLLKKKKYIAIEKLKEELKDIDLLIDYDMGLLRNIDKLDLTNKRVIGWSHAGEGAPEKNKRKNENMLKYKEIVTINKAMEIGYKKTYEAKGIKIHKIYNFLDEKKILQLSNELIEENLGKYILSVGSLTNNKNHKFLIESFKEFITELKSEVNLVILGDGEEKTSLINLIKDLKMENRIFLLGNKVNPYKYMKNCELYIQSSKNEAFPLVLMESMLLGKPIISSKTNGGCEILENGKYGLLFEKNEELKNNLKLLLENREEYEKYKELSLIKSKDFFKEKAKKTIEELIDNV